MSQAKTEKSRNSGFSSTNMSLSEPVRFLIFIVKDIPKMIVKAPFLLLFSFERFYLWDMARILHFVAQLAALIAIMKASRYEVTEMALNVFEMESPLALWIVTFVLIRVAFELVLVLLGIHSKLTSISETLKTQTR